MGKAKTIVLEALDGCGKTTQMDLLEQRFKNEKIKYLRLKFPTYHNQFSFMVKEYLKGRFGSSKNTSAYASSLYYAIDRHLAYHSDWEGWKTADEDKDTIILMDRYITANFIHQAVKLEGWSEMTRMIQWLKELEYEKLQVPKPTMVIYLKTHPVSMFQNLTERGGELDIHETDIGYINQAYVVGNKIAEEEGWQIVRCSVDPKIMKDKEIIHEDVWQKIQKIL
jgi:dTMP kinase